MRGTKIHVAAGSPAVAGAGVGASAGSAGAGTGAAARQSGKLILNNILNHVTRRGPYLGNSAGVLAMMYNLLNAYFPPDPYTPASLYPPPPNLRPIRSIKSSL